MRIRVRDTELYVDVVGEGLVVRGEAVEEKPVAVVLHGGPGFDHMDHRASLSPLSDRLQLVFLDHRGQGRSARGDPARYTLDETVEDLEALRIALGLGPVVSIGTSYGGMVAMAHAARYPDAVSRLVLVVTAAHAGFNDRAREIVRERGTPEQQAAADDLWAGRIDDVARMQAFFTVMAPLYATSHDPAAPPGAPAILSPEALHRAFAPGGFLHTFDLRPELAAITVPTLILAGRHDWICPPEFSQEIHHLIPGSTLRIFEYSGHSIRRDEPERLRAEIAAFVAGEAPPVLAPDAGRA